ncbi:MAG TPA: ABATE domain-containing protein [Pseudonocardia sp.]|jgi:predicted RNA-binding Zn ribbon-like protein
MRGANQSSSRAEPDAAETVLRFVNTRADGGGRSDVFARSADFAGWAAEHELLAADTVVSESDAVAARELRDALITVLLAHSGDPAIDAAEVGAAERYLGQAGTRYPLTARITATGARLVAGSTGVPGVLGQVLAAVTELAQRDEWTRIKACCNPSCHSGFVDRTRNRAGRYCCAGCGSRVSMRAMRQRRRDSGVR